MRIDFGTGAVAIGPAAPQAKTPKDCGSDSKTAFLQLVIKPELNYGWVSAGFYDNVVLELAVVAVKKEPWRQER